MTTELLIAMLINVGLVGILVQALKAWKRELLASADWAVPILAQVVAVLVVFGGDYFSRLLGHPIDFTPLNSVFDSILPGAIMSASFKPVRAASRALRIT